MMNLPYRSYVNQSNTSKGRLTQLLPGSAVASFERMACEEIAAYANISIETKSYYTSIALTMASLMVVVNVLTLFVIQKKKLYVVQSNKLILLMTIMDIGDAIINGYLKIIVLWFSSNISCETWTIIQYFLKFLYNSPIYIITLISLDRLLHVKFPSKYSLILTPFRFKCGMGVACALNAVQSTLFVILIMKYSMSTAKLAMTVINITILVFNGFIYSFSRKILTKVHAKNSIILTSNNRAMTTIATIYLFLIMVLKVVPMIVYFVLHSYAESYQQELAITLYLDRFLDCYGIVNSCIFLYVNRKARDYLKGFLCFKRISNTVANATSIAYVGS